MPASIKHLTDRRVNYYSMLARWKDGLYYSAALIKCDKVSKRCRVCFEDGSEVWVSNRDIHLQLQADKLVEDEDIVCCICDDGNSESPNEIILCDVCNQGYHQKCHNPPVDSSKLDGSDDVEQHIDWFCATCSFILNQTNRAKLDAVAQQNQKQDDSQKQEQPQKQEQSQKQEQPQKSATSREGSSKSDQVGGQKHKVEAPPPAKVRAVEREEKPSKQPTDSTKITQSHPSASPSASSPSVPKSQPPKVKQTPTIQQQQIQQQQPPQPSQQQQQQQPQPQSQSQPQPQPQLQQPQPSQQQQAKSTIGPVKGGVGQHQRSAPYYPLSSQVRATPVPSASTAALASMTASSALVVGSHSSGRTKMDLVKQSNRSSQRQLQMSSGPGVVDNLGGAVSLSPPKHAVRKSGVNFPTGAPEQPVRQSALPIATRSLPAATTVTNVAPILDHRSELGPAQPQMQHHASQPKIQSTVAPSSMAPRIPIPSTLGALVEQQKSIDKLVRNPSVEFRLVTSGEPRSVVTAAAAAVAAASSAQQIAKTSFETVNVNSLRGASSNSDSNHNEQQFITNPSMPPLNCKQVGKIKEPVHSSVDSQHLRGDTISSSIVKTSSLVASSGVVVVGAINKQTKADNRSCNNSSNNNNGNNNNNNKSSNSNNNNNNNDITSSGTATGISGNGAGDGVSSETKVDSTNA